jgi:hypothetical protein
MQMDEDDRERFLSESEDVLTDAVQIDAHADENYAEEIEEVVEEFYRRWKDAVDGSNSMLLMRTDFRSIIMGMGGFL